MLKTNQSLPLILIKYCFVLIWDNSVLSNIFVHHVNGQWYVGLFQWAMNVQLPKGFNFVWNGNSRIFLKTGDLKLLAPVFLYSFSDANVIWWRLRGGHRRRLQGGFFNHSMRLQLKRCRARSCGLGPHGAQLRWAGWGMCMRHTLVSSLHWIWTTLF